MKTLISAASVSEALARLAWHCYSGNPYVMTLFHRIAPRLDEIESECASGGPPGPPAELIIAYFVIGRVRCCFGTSRLTHGGPVQPPNQGCPYCTPVITVSERTHLVTDWSDYYQLGQSSAFVEPGAPRIASNNYVTYTSPDFYHRINYAANGLDDAAFLNPDGRKVLLAHSNTTQAKRFGIDWHGRAFTYTLPPGATATFVWQ